eukprot:Gregarina_sp_Poly_1__5750@NODE_3022_length_1446_cov_41_914431_g593_i1_p2_GENE_NODE_3022_length_1446_cov_41_914431_g593_i1NODE_3022_length_1446_cov_41_914431_g593_i1_p2_ORF_typecomplete_len229_score13_04_NODE_3022_length_1446_cov_41_914431_g593_i17231409
MPQNAGHNVEHDECFLNQCGQLRFSKGCQTPKTRRHRKRHDAIITYRTNSTNSNDFTQFLQRLLPNFRSAFSESNFYPFIKHFSRKTLLLYLPCHLPMMCITKPYAPEDFCTQSTTASDTGHTTNPWDLTGEIVQSYLGIYSEAVSRTQNPLSKPSNEHWQYQTILVGVDEHESSRPLLGTKKQPNLSNTICEVASIIYKLVVFCVAEWWKEILARRESRKEEDFFWP